MELTAKQQAWLDYKAARRVPQPAPVVMAVQSAPKGSPPRSYRRALSRVASHTRRGAKARAKIERIVRSAT